MKRCTCVALLMPLAVVMPRAAEAPLTFLRSIELPHVEGRIDHLAFDGRTGRLFVAALGNNTVEVVDTNAGTHVTSLSGFAEPQGIAVVPDARTVAVANGRNGRVVLLNADDLRERSAVPLGDDADNVRYDATANRLYVGYGSGAIGAIDPRDGRLIAHVAVPGHPESFQLERGGSRMFVNVPNAGEVVAIDRSGMTVVATWRASTASSCFPMALDEANHRLFIGCRRPAKALVLDTTSGREVASFDIVGDTDDLFYDASRKRLYVSGGEGFVDTIAEQAPNVFTRITHDATAPGARTSLFVADQRRFYLAVPHRGSQRAEIRVFEAH